MEEVRVALGVRMEMGGGRPSSMPLLLLLALLLRGLLRQPPRGLWPRAGRGALARAIVVGGECEFVEGAMCVVTGGR